MAIPEGYRIYWGTSKDNLDGVHPDPSKSSYNSPITVTGGLVEEYTFPADFWDSSFTTVYFSIAAYSGTDEGTLSTPIELGTCERTIPQGLQTFCIPLDDGNAYTPKQLVNVLGASQVFVKDGSLFRAYTAFSPQSGDILKPYTGLLVAMPAGKTVTWRGKPWSVVE